jgi:hypothetical protein
MTNVITSFAQLRSVFVALMISDSTEIAARMQLPLDLPSDARQINARVTSPLVIPMLGVGGVFETTNWVFSYPSSGKLGYIIRKQPGFWRTADPAAYRALAVPESAIDTNQALKLAVKWLVALSVDVPRLQSECSVRVEPKRVLAMWIPEYTVIWSRHSQTKASIIFLEPGEQLWQLRVEDHSYLKRPSITNGLSIFLREHDEGS